MAGGLLREVGQTLARYIRGQIIIAGTLLVLYATGFAILKVRWWFLIAVIASLLHLIPNIGAAFGLLIAAGVTWMAGGEFWRVAAVAGYVVAVLTFESYYLTPRILGRQLGLPPFMVFVAILIGGVLFGFWGLLLAAPVVAILNVFRKALKPRTEPPL